MEILCIQAKSEEIKMSPQVSPGSASMSKVLLPSKYVIPSSSEEKDSMVIHRYVSLAFFLAWEQMAKPSIMLIIVLHSESVVTPRMASFSREGFQYPLGTEQHYKKTEQFK